jgi:2-deoxy-D-gluconate 3-dehydrogenase
VTGRVVLITGAGRGVGRGIAEVMARAGATVVLNALTETYLAPAVEEIRSFATGEVRPVVADMTDPTTVKAVVDRVVDEFGRVDVLVNALGASSVKPLVALPGDSREPLSEEGLSHQIGINLLGTLLATRAVGPQMLARRSGKVINITTAIARGNGAIYAAGKAGVDAFTRAMAREWGPHNVQVNAIAPGLFPDPVSHPPEAISRAERTLAERVPLARFGRLEEVGLFARFLASPASDYLTGQVIALDGGASA